MIFVKGVAHRRQQIVVFRSSEAGSQVVVPKLAGSGSHRNLSALHIHRLYPRSTDSTLCVGPSSLGFDKPSRLRTSI